MGLSPFGKLLGGQALWISTAEQNVGNQDVLLWNEIKLVLSKYLKIVDEYGCSNKQCIDKTNQRSV